jgi:hypothetical protein
MTVLTELWMQVNQAQKQWLKRGRGGIVGGKTLDTKSKHGNKFWKYFLRKYSLQLMDPDDAPEWLRDFDCCGLVTKNHVSNRSNGAWAERTCDDCRGIDGSTKHGHSAGQRLCPVQIVKEKNRFFNDRRKRKLEEMRVLAETQDDFSDSSEASDESE